jgi:DNA-binding XRE family transcriptional regulator
MIDVKGVRTELKLTQNEMAIFFGVTQSALSLNEKRKSLPQHNIDKLRNTHYLIMKNQGET